MLFCGLYIFFRVYISPFTGSKFTLITRILGERSNQSSESADETIIGNLMFYEGRVYKRKLDKRIRRNEEVVRTDDYRKDAKQIVKI